MNARLANALPGFAHDLPGVGAADGTPCPAHQDQAEERVIREGLELGVSDAVSVVHGSTVTRPEALDQAPISMPSDLGFPSIVVKGMP